MVILHVFDQRLRSKLASVSLAATAFLFAYLSSFCIVGGGKSFATTDLFGIQLHFDDVMTPYRPFCICNGVLLVDCNRPISILGNVLYFAFFASGIHNVRNFLIKTRSELLIFVAVNRAFAKGNSLIIVLILCMSHFIGKVDL